MKEKQKAAVRPAWLYTPDGYRKEVHPQAETFTLKEVQELIGGYVEPLHHLPSLPGYLALFDEDGLRKQLPLNPRASEMVGTDLVGNVLVLPHALFK